MKNFLFVVVSFIIVIITSLIHKGSPVKRSVDGVPVFVLGLDVVSAIRSSPSSICFRSDALMSKLFTVPGAVFAFGISSAEPRYCAVVP